MTAAPTIQTQIFSKAMKTQIEIQNVKVRLSAKFAGAVNLWDAIRYSFKVTISTPSGRTSFMFYGSANDYMKGRQELNENELRQAADCFLRDAMSGAENFENFCSEYGYDTDSISALKTWKACKASTKKAERLFSDIYEAANELADKYNL